MTIVEASRQYKIPDAIISEYEKLSIPGKQAKESGLWECSSRDLELLSLMVTLHQSGLSTEDVKVYIRLVLKGKGTEKARLQILNRRREEALKELHLHESEVDLLDYLRYELQRDISNKSN